MSLNYEDFFTESDVETFKRVKKGQARLARIARSAACGMVGGEIQGSGKEFVQTRRGLYRLAMGANSDNTTEAVAHDQMGAITVVMGDDERLKWFFGSHGWTDPDAALLHFGMRVKEEWGTDDLGE
jgi:hypothetical protein